MAINVADNFSYKGSKPLDARIKYESVAAMAGAATADLYDGCLAYVTATKKYYTYDSSNTTDPTTGKWREYSSGGGGGTTVVANPEGEATDELEKLQVGNDIYSIPEENVEINKAQFDALPAATKNNGKAYFIPDASLVSNFTVMGNRFDKANIYDTTERMVGRWIDGKPLYQKTITDAISLNASQYTDISSYVPNIEQCISAEVIGSNVEDDIFYTVLGTKISNNVLSVQLTSYGWTLTSTAITLRYTKTTDASVAIGTENDYSTDEMIIGTWIDGKPIYQKTVVIDSLSKTGNQVNYNHEIADIDLVLTYDMTFINPSTGASGKVNSSSSSAYLLSCIEVSRSEISYQVGTAWSFTKGLCTIQYTKTTD